MNTDTNNKRRVEDTANTNSPGGDASTDPNAPRETDSAAPPVIIIEPPPADEDTEPIVITLDELGSTYKLLRDCGLSPVNALRLANRDTDAWNAFERERTMRLRNLATIRHQSVQLGAIDARTRHRRQRINAVRAEYRRRLNQPADGKLQQAHQRIDLLQKELDAANRKVARATIKGSDAAHWYRMYTGERDANAQRKNWQAVAKQLLDVIEISYGKDSIAYKTALEKVGAVRNG